MSRVIPHSAPGELLVLCAGLVWPPVAAFARVLCIFIYNIAKHSSFFALAADDIEQLIICAVALICRFWTLFFSTDFSASERKKRKHPWVRFSLALDLHLCSEMPQ